MGTRSKQTGGECTVESPGDIINRARAIIEREQRILHTEVEAFRAFHRRVDQIDSNTTATPNPFAFKGQLFEHIDSCLRTTTDDESSTETALMRVRLAYLGTVMAVPHYEEEYGNSYRESLNAEFGPGLASTLVDADGFTPISKEQLLSGVEAAIQTRIDALPALDREAATLIRATTIIDEIREELTAITSRPFFECEYDELEQLREDLDELNDRCEGLAERRQSGDLHNNTTLFNPPNTHILEKYPYGDTSTRYPILYTVAALSDRITTTKQHIMTAERTLDHGTGHRANR